VAKILISMPDDLLGAIDSAVEQQGTTRSAFLQHAARVALATPDPARVKAALERGRGALVGVGAFDSAALIRADRDTHAAADRRR